jgi:hypothetical protein
MNEAGAVAGRVACSFGAPTETARLSDENRDSNAVTGRVASPRRVAIVVLVRVAAPAHVDRREIGALRARIANTSLASPVAGSTGEGDVVHAGLSVAPFLAAFVVVFPHRWRARLASTGCVTGFEAVARVAVTA